MVPLVPPLPPVSSTSSKDAVGLPNILIPAMGVLDPRWETPRSWKGISPVANEHRSHLVYSSVLYEFGYCKLFPRPALGSAQVEFLAWEADVISGT